jgi:hypothetical protein
MEEGANLFTNPAGHIYGQPVLDYLTQTPTLVAWRVPVGAPGFYGTLHTHSGGGAEGLLKDWLNTLSSHNRFPKIVATPDSLFLLPVNPSPLYIEIAEACKR